MSVAGASAPAAARLAALLVPRPVDALAFPPLQLALAASLEGGPALELSRSRLDHRWIAVEDGTGGRRRRWSSRQLGLLSELALAHGSDGAILPYATAEHAQLDGRLLGPPTELAQHLADKAAFRALAVELGLRVPRHLALEGAPRHASLARELGSPYVLQTVRGSAGEGTCFVHGAGDVERACARHRGETRWLASELRDGPVLNAHVALTADAVELVSLSVQLTGAGGLGPNPAAYCGSDFAAAQQLPAWLRTAFAADLVRLGEALGARGWRGVLGVDAIADEEGAWLLEANPRMQASSWLLAELQRRAGAPVVGETHLAALRGDPLPASQSCELHGATLAIRAHAPCRAPDRRPGVYRLERGRLRFLRAEFGVAELAEGELFVDGCPRPGAVVERGAVLARASAPCGLLATDGRALGRYASAVAASLSAR